MLLCIFAEPILKLLFPNAYEGTIMLQISAWSIIFVVTMQTINGALQGLGKVNIPVIALGIGVIIKILLNILLINIEEIGVNGAIISSLTSHIVTFLICFIYLVKSTNIKFNFCKIIIKPIIASIIMSIICYGIYVKVNLNIIITLIIGIVIYIVLIIALGILSKEEIYMIPYGQKIYKIKERQMRKVLKNQRKAYR